MSKTISEVQASKKELEAKIGQMLLDFERENGVEVSGCYCNSYDRTITDDGNSTVMYGFPEHKVDFFISVRL